MAENNQQPAEELTQEQLSEQNRIRREKLKALQEAGKDPSASRTSSARISPARSSSSLIPLRDRRSSLPAA